MTARTALADVLLEHQARRNQPGEPIVTCACGELKAGQSWSFHVADKLLPVVDGIAAALRGDQ